jgi:hypothetical protein
MSFSIAKKRRRVAFRLSQEWLQLHIHEASLNLIHRLTNPLNFECPLLRSLLKLTTSKLGAPSFGPVSGVETRVRR